MATIVSNLIGLLSDVIAKINGIVVAQIGSKGNITWVDYTEAGAPYPEDYYLIYQEDSGSIYSGTYVAKDYGYWDDVGGSWVDTGGGASVPILWKRNGYESYDSEKVIYQLRDAADTYWCVGVNDGINPPTTLDTILWPYDTPPPSTETWVNRSVLHESQPV